MNVDLTPTEARYLSVLAAQDMRADRDRGLDLIADRHLPAWEKLQAACEWGHDSDE